MAGSSNRAAAVGEALGRVAGDGRDFEPRHSFAGVHLWFWGDVEGHITIEPGARFVVWYGGDIGEGTIQSC
ncbi:MAG TPA: hypothetical protein VFI46_04575 [Jiangellaceae bacterium]|nr:hypothetical protein [Jiangellaceae bacterium]